MCLPEVHRLTSLPSTLPAEQLTVLADGLNFRFEHILSGDHASPLGFWYDQPQAEWAVLIAGSATLEFEAGTVEMTAGDALLIEAHCRHRVARSLAAVWVALHFDEAPHPNPLPVGERE